MLLNIDYFDINVTLKGLIVFNGAVADIIYGACHQ
jgi:hypothetical protein